MRVFIFLGLITLLQAISLTVSSMKERCMIVSTNNNEHYLKADLTFRRFADQTIEEGFRVVLHNTETHDEQAYQISDGIFRKEFQLTERTWKVMQMLCTDSASRLFSAGLEKSVPSWNTTPI